MKNNMKICITLDDVLRAKTKQFGKIYKKGINNEVDLDSLDFSTNDLANIFNMTKKEYNKFLYEDYSFEIFAEAPVMEKMLDKKLNLWHIKLNDEENIELMLANTKEFNTSIGYTCFFLSQIATRVREIYFPKNSTELWDKCDILITADPDLLDNAPVWLTTVKIETNYNKDCPSSKSYESLSKLLDDADFINWVKERPTISKNPYENTAMQKYLDEKGCIGKIKPNKEGII